MDSLIEAKRPDESGTFGGLLRAWRVLRGLSQMALALSAGVSTRHVSYLETGRAMPSREMVLALSQALEVPLRERNWWLNAAGFAALYRETPLDATDLQPVRDALQFILAAMEPNPTFVVNRRYDVIDANGPGRWILQSFIADPTHHPAPWNMARLLIGSRGLRPFLENADSVARKVLGRLRRDLGGAHTRDARDEKLLAEVEHAWRQLEPDPSPLEAPALIVGVQLKRDDLALNLFTTIATLGTPLDVTLQELRIETLFPADAQTKQVLMNRCYDGANQTACER